MYARAIRGGEPDIADRRLHARNLRAALLRERLAVEDQRVLREVDDERQSDRDGEGDFQDRADQVL
jgi:hypothetical protein